MATVVETNIHKPTDSSLLVDCMRVISRVHFSIREILISEKVSPLKFSYKKSKYLALAILNAKKEEDRFPFYEKLILGCGDVFVQIPKLLTILQKVLLINKKRFIKLDTELRRVQGLMNGIIAQAIARIYDGEKVSASDKIISIFEGHSDVIVKGRRETEFGHKIFLSTGKSNLILDCIISEGNPCDTELFMPLITRLKEIFGKLPKQTSADGGFASQDNLRKAKDAGVSDICFAKRCGLEILDMVKSSWVYKKLKNFRAGIESNISALKRGFGLDRALWRGVDGFNSYVWSGIVACNLTLLATAK